jgi:hypothetical protein
MAEKSGIKSVSKKNQNPQRKPRNEVYKKIISGLLIKEKMTTGDIADYCGYENRGKEKYSYVTRQLDTLTNNRNYLEKNPGKPPVYYWIRKDIPTLWRMYSDPDLEEIKYKFVNSKWLPGLIADRRIETGLIDGSDKEDVEKMLRTSEILFELFFNPFIPNTYFGFLDISLDHPADLGGILPHKNRLPEQFSFGPEIYSFFVLCMFVEYQKSLLDWFKGAENIPPSKKPLTPEIFRKQRDLVVDMGNKAKHASIENLKLALREQEELKKSKSPNC